MKHHKILLPKKYMDITTMEPWITRGKSTAEKKTLKRSYEEIRMTNMICLCDGTSEKKKVHLCDWNIFLPFHFQVPSSVSSVRFPDYQISAIATAKHVNSMLYSIEEQSIEILYIDVTCTKFNTCRTSWYLSTVSRYKLLILELSFQLSHFFLRYYEAFTRVFLRENATVEVQ
jgi:hypothetical protein